MGQILASLEGLTCAEASRLLKRSRFYVERLARKGIIKTRVGVDDRVFYDQVGVEPLGGAEGPRSVWRAFRTRQITRIVTYVTLSSRLSMLTVKRGLSAERS